MRSKSRWILVAVLVLGGSIVGCNRGNSSATAPPPAQAVVTPDPDTGAMLYSRSCKECHGADCQGLVHHGPDLRRDVFIAAHTDDELIAFTKKGRPIKDPDNKTGVEMPAGGHIPGFGSDPDNDSMILADIVAFLRRVQAQTKHQDVLAAQHGPTTRSLTSTTGPATELGTVQQ